MKLVVMIENMKKMLLSDFQIFFLSCNSCTLTYECPMTPRQVPTVGVLRNR